MFSIIAGNLREGNFDFRRGGFNRSFV